MADNIIRVLFCLLDGESALFQVEARIADLVVDLKKSVCRKTRGVADAHEVLLYRLNQPVPLDPVHSLQHRIKNKGDIYSFADLLEEDNDSVGYLFPEHPDSMNLHFVVRPLSEEDRRPSKRARLISPVPEGRHRGMRICHAEWSDFWKTLWGKGLDHFRVQNTEVHSVEIDNTKVEFQVMKTHKAFRARVKGLLIRDEWDIAWSCARKAQAEGVHSFILAGQPGIGKTLSLYYFLSIRLAQGLPTFFQNHPDCVWFFNNGGVHLLDNGMDWWGIPGISRKDPPWALVDSDWKLKAPATLVCSGGAPFFIVYAASPCEGWRDWAEHHGTSQPFYSRPFLLEELLKGNQLQEWLVKEPDIHDFYMKYGPSARSCYRACSSPSQMTIYVHEVNTAISNLTWDSLGDVLRSKTESDLVVLIEPSDDKRICSIHSVITRTVMRFLWQQHGARLARQVRELFYGPVSRYLASTPTLGWMFEGPIHQQLEKGINIPFYPMAIETNKQGDAISDTYVTSMIGPSRWEAQPMEYVPFTENDGTLKVEPLRYYVPVHPMYPTLDSFAFEDIPISRYDDPIVNLGNYDLLEKDALANVNMSYIGVFTIFRVTNALEHDFNAESLKYVLALAKHRGLKAAAIRYVAIIPAGREVQIKVPLVWRQKLGMYVTQFAVRADMGYW